MEKAKRNHKECSRIFKIHYNMLLHMEYLRWGRRNAPIFCGRNGRRHLGFETLSCDQRSNYRKLMNILPLLTSTSLDRDVTSKRERVHI